MKEKKEIKRPGILIENEYNNMSATALDLRIISDYLIELDREPDNLSYVLDIKKMFEVLGLPYDSRSTFQKFRKIGSQAIADNNRMINIINEDGNLEQLVCLQDVIWIGEESKVQITLGERYKKIYTDPSESRVRIQVDEFLNLKKKVSKVFFPKILMRYQKSKKGKPTIPFNGEGTLNGQLFTDIWTIKKIRRELKFSETKYQTNRVIEECKEIAEDITKNTHYNCEVYFNYANDKESFRNHKILTHICWNFNREGKNLLDSRMISFEKILDNFSELSKSEKEMILRELVKKEDYTPKKLEEVINYSIGQQPETLIAYIISAIRKDYNTEKGKSSKNKFNNFDQRKYDWDTLEEQVFNQTSKQEK